MFSIRWTILEIET